MARLGEELTADFSNGMYDSVAPTRYPQASVALLQNGRIEPDGTIRRRSGSKRTHTTALVASAFGYGATRFTTAAGVDQIIVFFGSRVFVSTDYGATWEDMTPTTALSFGATGVLANPMAPNSWTNIGTPVITTGQTDPWGGTVAIRMQDDDAAATEGRSSTATFLSDGTKAATFVIAAGTAGVVYIALRDSTAGVNRHKVKVTWNGSAAPTTATAEGAGTITAPVAVVDSSGRRWWVITITATGVLFASTNICQVLIGNADADTGTVYVAGAEAWDAAVADFTAPVSILREDYYTFATMRVGATMYLFAANGDTTIQQWNGTYWKTLTGAPSGVKYLAVFNGRLYVGGHSGVILQASKIADPESWASPDGLTIQIMTHGGDVPTGMYQVGPHLLVFDRYATSYVDGYGEQTTIVAAGATGFSRSVGCVAFRTIVGIGDNGVCWLSQRGVEYYSPSSGIQLISKPVQVFLATIDWEQLYANPGRPCATYYETSQDYWLALATNGVRNDRVLVLNVLQNVQGQRGGQRSAAAIDRLASASGGDIAFGDDGGGYLGDGTAEADSDVEGYLTLLSGAGAGDPLGEDADGYLDSVANDSVPASLFVAPTANAATAVYSAAYDGFVRVHDSVDKDDMTSAETGGTAVELTVVSKPFLLQRPRQKKRVRAVHLASLQDAAASITVVVRGDGATTPAQTITMSPTSLEQAQRAFLRTRIDGDAPQVEIRTTDDVRLSMLGVSVELLRERI